MSEAHMTLPGDANFKVERYAGPIHLWVDGHDGNLYTVWRCRDCGAIINGNKTHDDWHDNCARVASDASWGGMLRPLK